ncbi:PQQ-dependent catabolism-associated CXXCW motif protein [Ancylobacter sp. A5.8]|nr:PQQ-dependent catabolism-associated CXXCW motif protein [Ancylobacter gelatini]MCJ8144204.1 PQQ-dependent catabolism-associated CXXCW motif protein [Ancylobacter gelatini]
MHETRPETRPARGDISLKRLAWLGMAGLLAVMLAFSQRPAVSAEVVPEPDGYRMDSYRAPTPPTLRGAAVLDTAAAEALWRAKGALFLDVMPRDVKPTNLPPGTIWRDKRRDHIPGSVWLPNVGYGALSPEMDAWFRKSLGDLTEGRRDAPMVFYCLTDCWMSWNAAKRAMDYGYSAVSWYPAGSDGWAKTGLPLEQATPRP